MHFIYTPHWKKKENFTGYFQTLSEKFKILHLVREEPFQNKLMVVNADAGNSPQQGGRAVGEYGE